MPMRKRKSLMMSSLNDVIARNGEELEIISVRTLKNVRLLLHDVVVL